MVVRPLGALPGHGSRMGEPPEKEKTLAKSRGTIEPDARDENSSVKFSRSRFVAAKS